MYVYVRICECVNMCVRNIWRKKSYVRCFIALDLSSLTSSNVALLFGKILLFYFLCLFFFFIIFASINPHFCHCMSVVLCHACICYVWKGKNFQTHFLFFLEIVYFFFLVHENCFLKNFLDLYLFFWCMRESSKRCMGMGLVQPFFATLFSPHASPHVPCLPLVISSQSMSSTVKPNCSIWLETIFWHINYEANGANVNEVL